MKLSAWRVQLKNNNLLFDVFIRSIVVAGCVFCERCRVPPLFLSLSLFIYLSLYLSLSLSLFLSPFSLLFFLSLSPSFFLTLFLLLSLSLFLSPFSLLFFLSLSPSFFLTLSLLLSLSLSLSFSLSFFHALAQMSLASKANPQLGGGWKNLYCCACHIWLFVGIYIYIYIYQYLPYLHNPESTRGRFYGTLL